MSARPTVPEAQGRARPFRLSDQAFASAPLVLTDQHAAELGQPFEAILARWVDASLVGGRGMAPIGTPLPGVSP